MSNIDRTGAIVGANVRAELGRANRSQTWLGERLDLTQASVSLRLNGRIALNVVELVRIAAVLDVPLGKLLDGAEPVRPVAETAAAS